MVLNNPPRVYLAGPIAACSFNDCTEWREYARKELGGYGIIGISPMRQKDFLRGIEKLGFDKVHLAKPGSVEAITTSDSGITARDHFDVKNCDLMLVNFFGSREISRGTLIEYGWASAYGKPIITVIELKGNPHEYPIVRDLTNFRTESLETGILIARSILAV